MIETANLKLVACELSHFEAFMRDRDELGTLLGVGLAEGWPHFPEAMDRGYELLKSDPGLLGWWTYLFIHTKERMLIGSGGFTGRANEHGVVEIGYEIAPAYRGRGYATEAARGLVDYAFSHDQIRAVDAHTLAEKNASVKVLERIGMKWQGAIVDPSDGEIWHWRVNREDYEAAR